MPNALEQLKLPSASTDIVTMEGWLPMAGMHKHIIYDKSLGIIAKVLRDGSEDVTHAPLPLRWVELILHLDEQERERSKSTRDEHGALGSPDEPTDA
jgi:hypothetical protein